MKQEAPVLKVSTPPPENHPLPAGSGGGRGGDRNIQAEKGGGSAPEMDKAEDNERNSSGNANRWPREETLALLKIRSDMDVAFRDANHKAPLWEHVSKKLAELGYSRSAKKCKEKFENTQKYHKRTREGISSRPYGKNYRFFEQLEALEHRPLIDPSSSDEIQNSITTASTVATTVHASMNTTSFTPSVIPGSIQNTPNTTGEDSTSMMSCPGKEELGGSNKKRKLMDYFEGLMQQVLERQQNLQNKLLEALEKCEKDRIAREEAWKMQELARLKRERELLAQERSVAAAKDAALLAFLQKFSSQEIPIHLRENQIQAEKAAVRMSANPVQSEKVAVQEKNDSRFGNNHSHASMSRWPKEEVEALIRTKIDTDARYQENGPKGPIWEEVSSAMKMLGYNRSAKRCKEKWENINKYFRRVKESKKRRPDAAKTCPYFQQLDALYREKEKRSSEEQFRPEELLMHMMGKPEEHRQMDPVENEEVNVTADDIHEEEEEEDDDDEEAGDDFHIVSNTLSSMATMC